MLSFKIDSKLMIKFNKQYNYYTYTDVKTVFGLLKVFCVLYRVNQFFLGFLDMLSQTCQKTGFIYIQDPKKKIFNV